MVRERLIRAVREPSVRGVTQQSKCATYGEDRPHHKSFDPSISVQREVPGDVRAYGSSCNASPSRRFGSTAYLKGEGDGDAASMASLPSSKTSGATVVPSPSPMTATTSAFRTQIAATAFGTESTT